MKTFILSLFMILSIGVPQRVSVVTTTTNVYASTEINAEVIGTLFHGDESEVIESVNGFYKIKYKDGHGYILISHTKDTSDTDIVRYPEFNGKVKAELAKLYIFNGTDYSELETTLKVNTEVKILSGYNPENKYTEISFYENDKVFTCFVLTYDIEPYGMNPKIIIAISLICTCLGILIILLGFKLRRKK